MQVASFFQARGYERLEISSFYLDEENAGEKSPPILLSIPHCGTEIPEDILSQFSVDRATLLEDTDWRVEELCNFGFRRIYARWSRCVVDLNRPSDDKALYSNPERLKTGLLPQTTFGGKALYHDSPSFKERERRLKKYYFPYHEMLAEELKRSAERHKHFLLIEFHSIKRSVPLIYPKPLPDFILGNGDGLTCSEELLRVAKNVLSAPKHFSVAVNDPFKGGEITRKYGQPSRGIHTLQLEMSQDIYLNPDFTMHPQKSREVGALLAQMVHALSLALGSLGDKDKNI